MRTTKWLACLLLAVAMLSSGVVRAEAEPQHVGVADYLQYLDDLREAFKEEKPKPLSDNEWRLFDDADAKARAAVAGHDNTETLSVAQKASLFEAQQTIIAVLDGKHDERVICRREGRVGTNLKKTHCVSVTQLRLERENARRMMREQALIAPMSSWQMGVRPGSANSLP